MLTALESDDDTPDNTHTQRVLAKYYLSTEGGLPPWLKLPPSLATATSSGSHWPTNSNSSSVSGSSMYRAGSKPVSLQDIYDSAGPAQQTSTQSRQGRNPELYASDQSSLGRQPLAGDRLRNKLRPSNPRPSTRPGSTGDQDSEFSASTRGATSYSGRSGFGGGDDYDPYNYHQYDPHSRRSRDQQQGNHSGGLPSRPGGRR